MIATEPDSLRVLVTGAAGGVGTAVVEHLVSTNCSVTALDLGFPGWRFGDNEHVRSVAIDLTQVSAISEAVDTAAEWMGGIDGLVYCAAILDNIHRAYRFSEHDWDREMNVNLDAAFRVVQAAYPYLCTAPAGRIVLVSSVAAELGQPGQVAYSASKAGLLGMMRTLAVEWGFEGITCNAVAPGFIETPMVRRLPVDIRDAYRERVPLARFASPEELAGVIAFLLSPAAGYVNGTVIRVDGGLGLNTLSLAAGRPTRTGGRAKS